MIRILIDRASSYRLVGENRARVVIYRARIVARNAVIARVAIIIIDAH